jgi:uncharacterized membrane protein YhaH (DUF805 family)
MFPERIDRSGYWVRTLLVTGLSAALQSPLYEWSLTILHGGGSLGAHFIRWLPISAICVALIWFSIEHIAMPRLIDAQWPRWLSFLLLVPFVSAPFILILGVTPTRPRRD